MGSTVVRRTVRGKHPFGRVVGSSNENEAGPVKDWVVWVSLILDNLADGVSEAEALKEYPQLRGEDIRAVLAVAAEATRERVVELAPVAP